ncbi:MAG: aromatic amino acid ammonia-lyase, partial [Paramuribaculum sp.]|nr:aromatic amino acid ammonia-lyase [Paramuribaculum sp.]
MTYSISPATLTIEQVGEILDKKIKLALSPEARELIVKCREFLDNKIEHSAEPIYGITTGFGSLCNISIGKEDLSRLQENLVKSHSCGCGDLVDPQIVRIMLLTKIKSLSFGNSGVQLSTVERLVEMFNADVIPVVYQQGSLGASGDLAPLANMCLPLLGLGDVYYKGEIRPSAEVMDELGWKPVRLVSKEGLALLNGTQFMSSHAVYALLKLRRLSRLADKIGALSLDVFDGRIEPFGDEVNAVRPHPGQLATARAVRGWLRGSEMIVRPKEHVQDPYSFRCMPQVHGAVKDAIDYVGHVIEIEINSPTDNPTIFPSEDIIVSAGNFHGEPIALPMDYLAVAASELANISERRIYQLISG